jgi:cytochrome c peroxidase
MFDPVARDVGRMGETDHLEDAYRFRTPSLRNVAITGPYGHNGAYRDLEGIIRHHLDPLAALDNWRPNNIVLPKTDERMQQLDYVSFANQLEIARLRRHVDIQSMVLGNEEIVSLVAFLQALTGGESVDGRLGKPNAVPSGLPVD